MSYFKFCSFIGTLQKKFYEKINCFAYFRCNPSKLQKK